MEAILITGGAGFIGANFIPYFLEKNKEYQVVNLDLLTYAGDISNFQPIGTKVKGVAKNYAFLLAILGAGLMILCLLTIRLNSYLSSYIK